MSTSFTVAIPTHNRRETALLAVASVLRQGRPADRILVLCDGCTDGTAEALRALDEPTVDVVELAKGPGYAYPHRNLPLENPEADVVTWLADDDLWLPDHLEQLGRIWDKDGEERVMACAPAVLIHEDDRMQWLARDWSVPQIRELMLRRENHLPMGAVSVRASAAREAGGWSGDHERAADWELWKAILAGPGGVSLAPEPSVLHFRATTRRQAWPDRVAQNTAWLTRISDPGEAVRVRAEMKAAEGVRSGEEYAALVELYDARALMSDRLGAMEADLAHGHGVIEELRRQNAQIEGLIVRAAESERLRAELLQTGDELAATRAELLRVGEEKQEEILRVGDEREAYAQQLRAIYDGRWWRLRPRRRRGRSG